VGTLLDMTGARWLLGATQKATEAGGDEGGRVRRGLPRSPVERVAQGIGLALGAPLGWLAIRAATGASPLVELTAHRALYAYLTLATAAAFAASGWLLGRKEARLRELMASLEQLATMDPLTGLHNRRFFDERLRLENALAERGARPLTLVMFDIDHFKEVNDRHGHLAGDRVLAAIGGALRGAARTGEVAARFGGEELALLLPGCGSAEGERAAERVRSLAVAAVEGAAVLPPSHAPSLSAGVATRSIGRAGTPETLLAAADRALYRAKELGRDRVEVASPG
jgi:diguanylate cyclase (GGDEF)-like protein